MPSRSPLPILVLVGLGSMFLYRISINIVDPDLWHEMALGREIVDRGMVPHEDTFAYTPTLSPVVHHEWGAGLIAYFLAVKVGAAGIVIAKYALAFGLAAVCSVSAYRRGAGVEVMSFLWPIAILLLDHGFSPIRAQMYSFLFTACLLYWMDRDLEGNRWWLVAWLVTFACWLNMHAGFLVGAGIYALYWLERVIRGEPHVHLLLAGVAMGILINANPYGTAYYRYLFRAVPMRRPLVDEWAPLWHSGTGYQIGLFLLSLVLLLYVIRGVGVTKFRGLPIVLVTAMFALKSTRMLDFYAITWICYVPAHLQSTPLGRAMQQLYANRYETMCALWTLVVLAMGSLAIVNKPWELRVPGRPVSGIMNAVFYPVGAVNYLAENGFHGNLMVPFDHGAYVTWKLYPDVKVSIDSRYEVAYPAGAVEENYRLYMAEERWEQILTSYPTDAVLVPMSLPLAKRISRVEDWQRVYSDGYFDVYARSTCAMPAVQVSAEAVSGEFP